MLFVSDFADGAVLLPVSLAVALWAVVVGWWRGLIAWTCVVAGTAALMLLLKTVSLALADGLPESEVSSPSGHVAGACVVYGGLLLMLGRGKAPALLLAPLPILIAALVGQARIALAAHSLAEVVAGAAVGCLASWALPALAGPRPTVVKWPAAALAGVTMFACHGWHLNSEAALQRAVASW